MEEKSGQYEKQYKKDREAAKKSLVMTIEEKLSGKTATGHTLEEEEEHQK